MIGIRRRANRLSLVASVVSVVVLAAGTNAALRTLGWNQPPGEIWPAFAPRGAIIGVVWIVLFACMGAAHWIVARSGTIEAVRNARRIALLIAVCLAYPFTRISFTVI